jgi:hypothetical protein
MRAVGVYSFSLLPVTRPVGLTITFAMGGQ